MSAPGKCNPYQLLGLRTTATEKEIIARKNELAGEVFDAKSKALIRQAAQEITGTRLDRALAQFFEPAESCYGNPAVKAGAAADSDDELLAVRASRFAVTDCGSASLAGLAAPPAAEGCAESPLDGLKIALLNRTTQAEAAS